MDAHPLCAACGMRLSEDAPDVVLRQLHGNEAGDVLRRYHPGCEAAALKLLEEAPEEWVMGLRFVTPMASSSPNPVEKRA